MVSILRRTEKGATMSRLKTTKDERTEWRGDYDEDVDRLLDDANLAAELEQEVEKLRQQLATAQNDALLEDDSLDIEIEVFCDDEFMASVCGPRVDVVTEALRYAYQYSTEGTIRTRLVIRHEMTDAELRELAERKP